MAGAAFAVLAAVAPHPAASAEEPRTLKIAGILSAGKEAPWETSFVASMDRVVAARPHGLEIEVDYTENVSDNAEQVFRTYAETGEYDILFGDTAYADAVEKLKDEFPDTMFVVSGSGNRGLGGNAYWVFVHAHEPAYATGVLAGKLTRSNVVGVVSTFPAEDTNDQINAFFAGAREANPQVRRKVTFVQSWFDPQKSNEATAAQAAVGADMIFEMSGAFEACQEKRIGCFGNYVDMARSAPEVVVASTIVRWIHRSAGSSTSGGRPRPQAPGSPLPRSPGGSPGAKARAISSSIPAGRAGSRTRSGKRSRRRVPPSGAARSPFPSTCPSRPPTDRIGSPTAMPPATPRLVVEGLTKRFGSLVAVDDVSLTVMPGELHCLLGENGAGKSTLSSCLYGLHRADAGRMKVEGRPYAPRSPLDAVEAGLGMVHQHFVLAPSFTALENIVVGTGTGWRLDLAAARRHVGELCASHGIALDLDRPVSELAVGERQWVEIVKALRLGARSLILDEPTAVLTPDEADGLFVILRRMTAAGLSVILITHKMGEVMRTDRVSVLRKGRLIDTIRTADTSRDELARMMMGRAPSGPAPPGAGFRRCGRRGPRAAQRARGLARGRPRTPPPRPGRSRAACRRDPGACRRRGERPGTALRDDRRPAAAGRGRVSGSTESASTGFPRGGSPGWASATSRTTASAMGSSPTSRSPRT